MVSGAGGWMMKMGKNRLCGICVMLMLRGGQYWHGAMSMRGSDGYGPCGSGTTAPGCQSNSWIFNEDSMGMMRTIVTSMVQMVVPRMLIMGVMVRFYIVLHDFILRSQPLNHIGTILGPYRDHIWTISGPYRDFLIRWCFSGPSESQWWGERGI